MSQNQRILSILGIILSIITGLLFIYSAYSKLYPIEFFEITFVDISIANWYTAPFIARLFIALEFILGTLLITNINTNKWVYKLSLATLLTFTIYLSIILLVQGNEGNCGCFGEHIKMTPLQGILKNIPLIGILIYLLYNGNEFGIKYKRAVIGIIAGTGLALPFILNPISIENSSKNDISASGYSLPLDILYQSKINTSPSTELRKGKWVLAYLSLTCPHCRIAAYKLSTMKKTNSSLPIYFILNGKDSYKKNFYTETKSASMPQAFFKGGDEFIQMSGPELPAIFFIENGKVVKKVGYHQITQSEIEEWYQ